MGKATQTDPHVPDHDLHPQAVGLCGQHNQAAKLLQKALDQRHQTVIKRFARLLGEAAALTHPDVGHTGVRQAFGHATTRPGPVAQSACGPSCSAGPR